MERAIATNDRRAASTEAELQSLRAKQLENDEAKSNLTAQRDDLERKLNSMSSKFRTYEEVVMTADRDRAILEDQVMKLKELAENEGMQRLKTDDAKRQLERELQNAQQRLVKQERISVDLQSDVESLTAQLGQSKALENKTTIEHVHTLEKAMKLQDRELLNAQTKLESSQQLIKTLEKTKARLTAELQDVGFAQHQDVAAQRAIDKKIASLEKNAKNVSESLDRERRAREVADATTRKVQGDLRIVQAQLQTAHSTLTNLEKSKKSLEGELASLAKGSSSPSFHSYSNIGSNPTGTHGKQHLLEQLERNTAEMADQMGAR